MRASARQGAQVTRPYPNTDNQYPVECGPITKEQFEQVWGYVYSCCPDFMWSGDCGISYNLRGLTILTRIYFAREFYRSQQKAIERSNKTKKDNGKTFSLVGK